MNGGSAAKIRFVRCPKCRQVLVEPQDIPVYKCGGCGTHLQVKNRKSNPEVATSGLHETDAAQKNRSDHISEAKESSSSNHEEIFHPPGNVLQTNSMGGIVLHLAIVILIISVVQTYQKNCEGVEVIEMVLEILIVSNLEV